MNTATLKLDATKCTRCKGKGFRDTPRAHLAVPGLCFDCAGSGARADQNETKAKAKLAKAVDEKMRGTLAKVWEKKVAFGDLPHRERRALGDVVMTVATTGKDKYPRFTAAKLAAALSRPVGEVFTDLCRSYPTFSPDFTDEGEAVGWVYG